MKDIPKSLDLDTASLLVQLFSNFEKDKNEKVNQSIKTILGILLSVQAEKLREKFGKADA